MNSELKIKLTQTVKKGGCAAKLPAGELRSFLSKLPLIKPDELVVGTEHLDDACLWDLGNGQYMIQTLDFFTPVVDDAYDFGAIAAANALSDVYAMGGEPRTALSILAFPLSTLPLSLVEELMRGAVDKIQEAGACLAGGHSIDDETLKFGFSVTGFVSHQGAWTNQGAQVGDALILTKGLGTGTMMTALKEGELDEGLATSAFESMKQLNRVKDLLGDSVIHAATDITGFGLAGHGMQVAQASQVSLEIDCSRVPVLPGALNLLSEGYLNRAHKTNNDYVKGQVDFSSIQGDQRILYNHLMCDAQTSGGLLLCVPYESAEPILKRITRRFPRASIVGRVQNRTGNERIRFYSSNPSLGDRPS